MTLLAYSNAVNDAGVTSKSCDMSGCHSDCWCDAANQVLLADLTALAFPERLLFMRVAGTFSGVLSPKAARLEFCFPSLTK